MTPQINILKVPELSDTIAEITLAAEMHHDSNEPTVRLEEFRVEDALTLNLGYDVMPKRTMEAILTLAKDAAHFYLRRKLTQEETLQLEKSVTAHRTMGNDIPHIVGLTPMGVYHRFGYLITEEVQGEPYHSFPGMLYTKFAKERRASKVWMPIFSNRAYVQYNSTASEIGALAHEAQQIINNNHLAGQTPYNLLLLGTLNRHRKSTGGKPA